MNGECFLMIVVVLTQYKEVYMLRHIIYDVANTDTIETIKDNYYRIYNKTDTDEFILCNDMENVNIVLHTHGIK